MKRKERLEEVQWVDHVGNGSWGERAAREAMKPIVCRTVGYLLTDAKTHIVISQTLSDNGDVDHTMCIHKRLIASRRRLR